MAVIPTLNRPQVRATAEPSRQRPFESYGTDTRGLQAVAGGVLEVASAVQREADRIGEIRANEAEVDFAGRTAREQAGFLAKQGKNAVEDFDGFTDRVRMAASEVEAGLATDRQRALFRLNAQRRMVALESQAMAHLAREQERMDDLSHDALQAEDGELIATTPMNAALVDATVARMADRITLYGDRKGWTPEVRQRERAEVVSTARARQVVALANVETPAAIEQARAVLTQHGPQMTQKDRADATKVLEDSTIRTQAQAAVADIVGKHGDDERAALAAVRDGYSGALEDTVRDRIVQHFATERRLKVEETNAVLDRALGNVERGEAIATADRDYLLLNEPGKLAMLRTRARQVANGTQPVTDWDTYEALFVAMPNDQLAAVNPSEYRTKLSDSDYKALVDRIATLRQTGGRGDRGLTPGQVSTELLAQARALGLVEPTVRTFTDLKKKPGDNKQFTVLNDAVRVEMENRRAANGGRPLSGTEQREAMQAVLDDVVITKGMFGGLIGGGEIIPRAFAPDGRGVRELTPAEAAAREVIAPDFSARAMELQRAGMPRDSIAATLAREGWDLNTGTRRVR